MAAIALHCIAVSSVQPNVAFDSCTTFEKVMTIVAISTAAVFTIELGARVRLQGIVKFLTGHSCKSERASRPLKQHDARCDCKGVNDRLLNWLDSLVLLFLWPVVVAYSPVGMGMGFFRLFVFLRLMAAHTYPSRHKLKACWQACVNKCLPSSAEECRGSNEHPYSTFRHLAEVISAVLENASFLLVLLLYVLLALSLAVIVGLELFFNSLSRRCVLPGSTTTMAADGELDMFCGRDASSAGGVCGANFTCDLEFGSPHQGRQSFDNFYEGWWTVSQIITASNWSLLATGLPYP